MILSGGKNTMSMSKVTQFQRGGCSTQSWLCNFRPSLLLPIITSFAYQNSGLTGKSFSHMSCSYKLKILTNYFISTFVLLKRVGEAERQI